MNDTNDSNNRKHIKTTTITILHIFKKAEERMSLLRRDMTDTTKDLTLNSRKGKYNVENKVYSG